jgi:hypothetical protein
MNLGAIPQDSCGFDAGVLAPRRVKFHPRREILDEVVAGFLWMQLNLPEDVSRDELEAFARRLIVRIAAGASQAATESEIAALQRSQFCRPVDPATVCSLAMRSMAAVKSA